MNAGAFYVLVLLAKFRFNPKFMILILLTPMYRQLKVGTPSVSFPDCLPPRDLGVRATCGSLDA